MAGGPEDLKAALGNFLSFVSPTFPQDCCNNVHLENFGVNLVGGVKDNADLNLQHLGLEHLLGGLLVGGFKDFLFSALPGEVIQFDEHIFQRGWNHQLATVAAKDSIDRLKWICPPPGLFILEWNYPQPGFQWPPGFWTTFSRESRTKNLHLWLASWVDLTDGNFDTDFILFGKPKNGSRSIISWTKKHHDAGVFQLCPNSFPFPIWQPEKLRPVGDVWGSLYVFFFSFLVCKNNCLLKGCKKNPWFAAGKSIHLNEGIEVGEMVLTGMQLHTLIFRTFQFGVSKSGSKLIWVFDMFIYPYIWNIIWSQVRHFVGIQRGIHGDSCCHPSPW